MYATPGMRLWTPSTPKPKLIGFVLLMAILLLSLRWPMPPSAVLGAPRAHPQLLALAAAEPQTSVNVIVQQDKSASGLEAQVMALGGTVTRQLELINAFSAIVPAGAIPALATQAGVRWVSPDAQLLRPSACATCVETSKAKSDWVKTLQLNQLRMWYPDLQGQGVTVAVLDSGVALGPDFQSTNGMNRVIDQVSTNLQDPDPADKFGHGTHVAGIIAGNGSASGGLMVGIAPMANIINVRVNDANGAATTSDVVAGLQWIYQHRDIYNIRVVNISLNSNVAESYHTSPLDAAVEILWFGKIVVVVSAGNNGNGIIYPPANDPFVITVGATDERGSQLRDDDTITSYSARGQTSDGFMKPELVAPGAKITSVGCGRCTMNQKYAQNVATGFPGAENYFTASGTSISAAITSGVVALMIQRDPSATPDMIKRRLIETGYHWPFGHNGPRYLRADHAITSSGTQVANAGITASRMLWTNEIPLVWGATNWDSTNWDSTNWDSTNWDSTNWDSTNWDSLVSTSVYWPE